ncbi:hypothetical protein [Planococcus salinus]|uniref:hypothetical protein n=1 Tax=Planococcus salinus TaxID=1848460 RepID=UPI001314006A|nr:hypothetical protein [Planococcus salinus]
MACPNPSVFPFYMLFNDYTDGNAKRCCFVQMRYFKAEKTADKRNQIDQKNGACGSDDAEPEVLYNFDET